MEVGEPPPSQEKDNLTEQLPKITSNINLYETWHKGPYVVYISSRDGNINNLHPMKIGKALYGNKEFNISSITRKGRNRVEITFPTSFMANAFVKSNISQTLEVKSFIPFHRTATIGIAKGIPTEFTDEEIKKQASTREGFPIRDVYRFKRKIVQSDGKHEWLPTQTVKITFHSQTLPERLFIYGATASLEPYIQPILQCRNCLNYGHLTKFCRQRTFCVKCSGQHTEDECTTTELKCKHCSLKHRATDKQCPTYILQTKISHLMSQNNIPFHEAREVYQGNSTLSAVLQNRLQHTNIPLPGKTAPKRPEVFPPLHSPSPAKRKLEWKHSTEQFPSNQVKQFLISPNGRTPEVSSKIDRPFSSTNTTLTCKSQNNPKDLGQDHPLASSSGTIKRPARSHTQEHDKGDNSYPSFKLMDLAMFNQYISELMLLQKALPDQFKHTLSVIINNLKLH